MSRRVLVCGASAGIGRAIALGFAQQGDTVFGLARREERLNELVPKGVFPIVADLDDREEALSRVRMHLPFHVVINNTGGPASGSLIEASCVELENGFARHVLVSHMILQAVLPGMMKEDFGRFINIISTSVYSAARRITASTTSRSRSLHLRMRRALQDKSR